MKRILAAAAIAALFPAAAIAGENSEKSDEFYTAPSKSIQLSFDYAKFSQKGFPALKSDFGFAFSVYHSYWLWKPRSHRFQLGIDVAWTDINYYNYKINLRTFDGYTTRYTMHSGDIGLQVGCGVNFNITRDIRLHARACYNPAFAGLYNNDSFQGAFANYGVAGVSLSWKHIGLGIDARFGGAKYKDVVADIIGEEEDDDSIGDPVINRPGSSADGSRISTKLFSLRTSLVFTF